MADFQDCLNGSNIKTTPILEKIAVAGEAGYEAIELWHDDIDALLGKGGSLLCHKLPNEYYEKG